MDCDGANNLVVDAHRDNGKRFVVHADGKLSAFLELERAIHEFGGFDLVNRFVVAVWSAKRQNRLS